MPGIRADNINRNVRFLDGVDDEVLGFFQNGPVTWGDMAEWLQILLVMPQAAYAIWTCPMGRVEEAHHLHGTRIPLSSSSSMVIEAGYYAILSPEGEAITLYITPEQAIPRAVSFNISTSDPRESSFRERVRIRDMGCVISGRRVYKNNFTLFESAHIFPLAHLDMWTDGGWSALLTDDNVPGTTGIHSVQNGLLLESGIHKQFDKYEVAVDPDNAYKVTVFVETDPGYGGGQIMYRNPDAPEKYQPSRALLKRHFRMAVLCNMKGRGAVYDWDEDIPPGMDSVQEISNSEQGKLRFELVMASRLNSLNG